MRFTASQVAQVVGGRLSGPDVPVDGASFDSRTLRPGQLFVPIVAARDGHAFIADALAAGAPAYLTEREPLPGTTAIRVADTRAALLALGAAARARLPDRVVGITGSVGKTTVKDLAAAALATTFPTVASPRSFNNELGLPTTLLDAPDDTEAAVLEMGMRGFGHIALLCRVAPPTIGLITVIGHAHTEQVGGIDGVAQAKGELVASLPPSGIAILNADQPEWLGKLSARTPARILTFGVRAGDVQATDVHLDDAARPAFTLHTPWGHARVRLAQSGAHLALNAAAAAAAALAAGVPIEQVACGLERATVSGGRSELTRTATGALLLDDSYNANPTSLAAALDTLVALGGSGRRVAVLGLMAELGPEGPAQHRRLADRARALGIEVIAVDTDAYGIPAMGPDEALERLRGLGPGDVVLVKASRAVGLDRLVNRLKA